MDLLTVISRDTPLRRASSTGGGEWAGPCPFCGGRDRFRVQPERGRWWCRQCSAGERWEDGIAYLRRRDGLSFREACEAMGRYELATSSGRPSRPLPPPRPEPSAAWRTAATHAHEGCVTALWSPLGARARAWLHRRGLSEATLRDWRLGYSVGQQMEGLWIPRGIVLPWFAAGKLWQLKIRRPVTGTDQPKYAAVRGGSPHLFGTDALASRDILVLAEGEFDALLLWQEACDQVDVATLGSCSGTPSEDVLWRLIRYRRVLLAYDMDAAGEGGASRLLSLSSRLRRIHLPHGEDVTDFHLAGGSLRDWIRFHLTPL